MKQIMNSRRPYGLRLRFVTSLILSAAVGIILYNVLYYSAVSGFENYVANSSFEKNHAEKMGKSLQKYVDKNQISSKDVDKISEWEKKKPVILLEIYKDNKYLYSSFHTEDSLEDNEVISYDSDSSITLHLTDADVVAVMYSDFTYRYYVAIMVVSMILSVIVFILLFLGTNRKMIRYIRRLNEEVGMLEAGNLEFPVTEEGNDELTDLAKSMNRMRVSFQQQMEEEQRLHDMNKTLISQMSHDLRTPLTGIMLYLEIIKYHRYESEEELQSYLKKIDEKAQNMKLISDNLFSYSLDKSQDPMKPVKMEKAFGRRLFDLQEELRERGYSVHSNFTWSQDLVCVKKEYLLRIMENIISNIVKYADIQNEILIDTVDSEQYCGFSVGNGCSQEQPGAESNGIGIQSIRTMVKEMKGICTIDEMEGFYMITLMFPKQKEDQS